MISMSLPSFKPQISDEYLSTVDTRVSNSLHFSCVLNSYLVNTENSRSMALDACSAIHFCDLYQPPFLKK